MNCGSLGAPWRWVARAWPAGALVRLYRFTGEPLVRRFRKSCLGRHGKKCGNGRPTVRWPLPLCCHPSWVGHRAERERPTCGASTSMAEFVSDAGPPARGAGCRPLTNRICPSLTRLAVTPGIGITLGMSPSARRELSCSSLTLVSQSSSGSSR